MDPKIVAEWLWKGVTVVLFPILVAGGGWIWTTQNEIIRHRTESVSEIDQLKEDVIELKDQMKLNSTLRDDVIEMKVDIKYIKEAQDRIERALSKP
jgi:CRISPR/Cas system CMR subunit Cmr4 (Cas7 group RAMP superfamily)